MKELSAFHSEANILYSHFCFQLEYTISVDRFSFFLSFCVIQKSCIQKLCRSFVKEKMSKQKWMYKKKLYYVIIEKPQMILMSARAFRTLLTHADNETKKNSAKNKCIHKNKEREKSETTEQSAQHIISSHATRRSSSSTSSPSTPQWSWSHEKQFPPYKFLN